MRAAAVAFLIANVSSHRVSCHRSRKNVPIDLLLFE
jgi:hypothetical protein